VTDYPIRRKRQPGRASWPRITGWFTGAALSLLAASAAMAQTQCGDTAKLGVTQLRVTEQFGRALIELTRPNSAGRKIEIEVGEEFYIGQFDHEGSVRLGFALTAANTDVTVRIAETPAITCKIEVADFAKIHRVVMRWRDPVQFDLHVIEPGGKLGGVGHISPARPNTDFAEGIGHLDILGGIPVEGATAEASYVVRDGTAIPASAVFSYRAEFVTRGMKPEPPYCNDYRLAAPRLELIVIARGEVTTYKLGSNHARCGAVIPEIRRLMVLRP